jgi:hypothetical protein
MSKCLKYSIRIDSSAHHSQKWTLKKIKMKFEVKPYQFVRNIIIFKDNFGGKFQF